MTSASFPVSPFCICSLFSSGLQFGLLGGPLESFWNFIGSKVSVSLFVIIFKPVFAFQSETGATVVKDHTTRLVEPKPEAKIGQGIGVDADAAVVGDGEGRRAKLRTKEVKGHDGEDIYEQREAASATTVTTEAASVGTVQKTGIATVTDDAYLPLPLGGTSATAEPPSSCSLFLAYSTTLLFVLMLGGLAYLLFSLYQLYGCYLLLNGLMVPFVLNTLVRTFILLSLFYEPIFCL